ncbi:unnamed protein product, partial [Mesorhabditis spiculigera]
MFQVRHKKCINQINESEVAAHQTWKRQQPRAVPRVIASRLQMSPMRMAGRYSFQPALHKRYVNNHHNDDHNNYDHDDDDDNDDDDYYYYYNDDDDDDDNHDDNDDDNYNYNDDDDYNYDHDDDNDDNDDNHNNDYACYCGALPNVTLGAIGRTKRQIFINDRDCTVQQQRLTCAGDTAAAKYELQLLGWSSTILYDQTACTSVTVQPITCTYVGLWTYESSEVAAWKCLAGPLDNSCQ